MKKSCIVSHPPWWSRVNLIKIQSQLSEVVFNSTLSSHLFTHTHKNYLNLLKESSVVTQSRIIQHIFGALSSTYSTFIVFGRRRIRVCCHSSWSGLTALWKVSLLPNMSSSHPITLKLQTQILLIFPSNKYKSPAKQIQISFKQNTEEKSGLSRKHQTVFVSLLFCSHCFGQKKWFVNTFVNCMIAKIIEQ